MPRAARSARKNRKTIRKRAKKITGLYKKNRKRKSGKPPGISPNLILSPVRMGASGPYRRWISAEEKKGIDAESQGRTMDELINEQKKKAEADSLNTIGGIKSKMLNVDKRFDKMDKQTNDITNRINQLRPSTMDPEDIEKEIKLRQLQKKAEADPDKQEQIEVTERLAARALGDMKFDDDVMDFLKNIENETAKQEKAKKVQEKEQEKEQEKGQEEYKRQQEEYKRQQEEKRVSMESLIETNQIYNDDVFKNADYNSLTEEVMKGETTVEEAEQIINGINDTMRDMQEKVGVGAIDDFMYKGTKGAHNGEMNASIKVTPRKNEKGKTVHDVEVTKATLELGGQSVKPAIIKGLENSISRAGKMSQKAFIEGDIEKGVKYKNLEKTAQERLDAEKNGEGREHSSSLFKDNRLEQIKGMQIHEVGHLFHSKNAYDFATTFGFTPKDIKDLNNYNELKNKNKLDQLDPTERTRIENDMLPKAAEFSDKYGVTERAKDNPAEGIAENFTYFERGHLHKMHPDMIDFISKRTNFSGDLGWETRVYAATGKKSKELLKEASDKVKSNKQENKTM